MIRHLGNFDASFQTSTLPETNSQFVPGNRPGPRQEETRKPSNVSFREGKEYLWIHMIHHFPTKKPCESCQASADLWLYWRDEARRG